MTADPPVLEPGRFSELVESVGGDMEFVAELASTFLAEADGLLQGLGSGLATGDRELVRRSAHTLKSTSNSLALMAVSELSAQIEGLARDGVLEDVAGLLQPLEARYLDARKALRERVGLA